MTILVCLDGEPHTRGAIEHAIGRALAESAEVVGLHVVDPWLKQFYSEIYAQGRKEYLEWVDECLKADALRTAQEFDALCEAHGVEADFKIRHGDPLAEIVDEVAALDAGLVITGAKTLSRWGRLRSGNLPQRLATRLGDRVAVAAIDAADPGLESAQSPTRPELRA